MKPSSKKKAKLFDISLFPMDMARIVCALLPLVLRLHKITPEDETYKEKLKGGAILVANHTSFIDPFLVATTFWYRRVFFLVAEIVMKGKLKSWLLRGVGSIKIDRSVADIEAIRRSVAVLKEGRVLVVFPQGGIMQDEQVETIKSGAVLMALQANVPIIPMHISTRPHWYNRRKVIIGNTIEPTKIITKKFPSTADITAVSDMVMAEMNRCNLNNKE